MKYTPEEVIRYVSEEDVKFIRLIFCDIYGRQKNIAVMPGALERAFRDGMGVDASSIDGFGDETSSDLFIHPDPGTLAILPWRPERGRVVRMFCDVTAPDGSAFPCCTRSVLKAAIRHAEEAGVSFRFASELEFYLFRNDEQGNRTQIPFDEAGYMDIAPDDRGENVRREICLALEKMGIAPERSHHEAGPGQNEIDFRTADPLTAADDAMTFRSAVRSVSGQNGCRADFSPKPLEDAPGSGFHIHFSAAGADGQDLLEPVIAGILDHIREITVFLNPTKESYARLGKHKAPRWISWSHENRSQLIRVPAVAPGEERRAELRSPDPTANPYLAFAVLIEAGLDGIRRGLVPPEEANFNLFTVSREILNRFDTLPETFEDAASVMKRSAFPASFLPPELVTLYGKNGEWEF